MSDKPCVFCQIREGTLPATMVYETDRTMAFLDQAPLFRGHILLVPRQHVVTLDEVPADVLPPMMREAQRLCRAVQQAMDAQGTFVAVNNRVSQTVPHRKGDGLRGFFWPRQKYDGFDHMQDVAASIRDAFNAIELPE